MRRRAPVLAGAAMLAFVLAGCEGPTGPMGPAGTAGPAGPQGPAGPAGNSTCQECHNDDSRIVVRELQYQFSVHYLGGDYDRNEAPCAACHTHQGFIERIASGAQTAGPIDDPSPQGCRTCHQIHTTFTDSDFALTTTAPVSLWYAPGETVDFGEGNLCAQCHQARPVTPLPTIGGPDVTVTSSRYGGHHSPVAEVMGGVGLFEFPGSATIDGGPFVHGGPSVGCAKCHMATPINGAQAGGHSLNMAADGDDNVNGCNSSGCHSTVEDFNKYGVQADVQGKLDQLATLLRAKGIMAAAPSVSSVAGTWPANVAAAFLNWQMITEDKSLGIHNPPYVLDVLQNTIQAMQ